MRVPVYQPGAVSSPKTPVIDLAQPRKPGSDTADVLGVATKGAELLTESLLKRVESVNKTRINSALNDLDQYEIDRRHAVQNIRGVSVLRQGDGGNERLTDLEMSSWERVVEQKRNDLGGNPQLQEQFDLEAARRRLRFNDHLQDHEGTQLRRYEDETYQQTVDSGLSLFAVDPLSKGGLDALASVWAEQRRYGQSTLGAAPEVSPEIGKAYYDAAMVLVRDKRYADAMQLTDRVAGDTRFSSAIPAEYLTKVRAVAAAGARWEERSDSAARTADLHAPQLRSGGAGDADGFQFGVLPVEGWRPGQAPSDKGAHGPSQITRPASDHYAKANKLDPDKVWAQVVSDTDFNLQVGQWYFNNALKNQKGDLRRAWAEYNTGAGNMEFVDRIAKERNVGWHEALRLLGEESLAKNPHNTNSFMQTYNYVNKAQAAYDKRASGPQRGRSVNDLVLEYSQSLTSDPSISKEDYAMMVSTYRQRLTLHQEAQKSADAETLNWHMDYVSQTGLIHPEAAGLPRELRDKLTAYQKSRGADGQVGTGAQLVYYNNLLLQINRGDSIPEGSWSVAKKSMSDTQYQHAKQMYEERRSKVGTLATLQAAVTTNYVDKLLQLSGSANPRGVDNRTRRNLALQGAALTGALASLLLTKETALNRKLSPATIEHAVGNVLNLSVLAEERRWQDAWLRRWPTTKPVISMTYDDIPEADALAIRNRLLASGASDSDDGALEAAVLTQYLTDKIAPAFRNLQ